jgi:hypothetical protein
MSDTIIYIESPAGYAHVDHEGTGLVLRYGLEGDKFRRTFQCGQSFMEFRERQEDNFASRSEAIRRALELMEVLP